MSCAPYTSGHTSQEIADWIVVRLKTFNYLNRTRYSFTSLLNTQRVTEEWKISDRLGVITTDSAANMLGLSCVLLSCLFLPFFVLPFLVLPIFVLHHPDFQAS